MPLPGDPPDSARVMQAIDVTWPPAEMLRDAPWLLRRGAGGGKRVSAASPNGGGPGDARAIARAEAAMRGWSQVPMFRLIEADVDLDTRLAARGYTIVDPVALYVAPVPALGGERSHIAVAYQAEFAPAVLDEIWQAGGIGPARRAVMERVTVPSRRLMSRVGDRACAGAFVAIDRAVAMIHAIEVLPAFRRRGAARLLIEAAARFAARHGAGWLALAVTEANGPARALYDGLGMTVNGGYHYRVAPDP